LSFLKIAEDISLFYFSYFVLFVLAVGTVLFFAKKIDLLLIKKFFLVLFPTEIILLFSLEKSRLFNSALYFPVGAYLIIAIFYLISCHKFQWRELGQKLSFRLRVKNWLGSQGKIAIGVVLLVMILSALFGAYHIAKFAAVDEPLWFYDRIPGFWKDVKTHNWYGATVSDKPGLTVALISGIGLLSENPKDYQDLSLAEKNTKNIENLNLAFRLPLYLFIVLMLPFIYFFLERLLGKLPALFSIIFIGLSPILIGLGRIINPDAILWVFTTLSLLSYFVYLRKRNRAYLYWAGIFLGLSILTKYVANILYIFFFLMIFSEYIFNAEKYKELAMKKYIWESLVDYLFLVFSSLATFYVLYPAVWMKIDRLLTGTIFSQAFLPVYKPFLLAIFFVLADNLILSSRIVSFLLNLLAKVKKHILYLFIIIFLIATTIVLVDVYSGMKFFNFEIILASPKTSYLQAKFLGTFLTNFYPLIFGIIPLAFISAMLALFWGIKKEDVSDNRASQIIFYSIAFILMYYLGSAVSKVVSIVRYQIMLFPLILIVAGIGFYWLSNRFGQKGKIAFLIVAILINVYSLCRTYPFYMSYASSLLPQKYFLDIKDMGAGSYEAAQFLNSLPNSQNLTVWTDKRGLCAFFKGQCSSTFTASQLLKTHLDYVVVSSGRQKRTTGMVLPLKSQPILVEEGKVFDKYYKQEENMVFEVEINNRPDQYVKVFKAQK